MCLSLSRCVRERERDSIGRCRNAFGILEGCIRGACALFSSVSKGIVRARRVVQRLSERENASKREGDVKRSLEQFDGQKANKSYCTTIRIVLFSVVYCASSYLR